MTDELRDKILDGEFFKDIPYDLHKEGKNVILGEEKLPGGMYIVYPNKKAFLIRFDYSTKKNIIGRELTEEEYKIIGIEYFWGNE